MDRKRKALRLARLYAVTDITHIDEHMVRTVERALRGGVDIIQLRSHVLSDGELLTIGRSMRACARRLRKLFIVNDRVDIALALDADGVHVGQGDMPLGEVHRILKRSGSSMLVGVSTHSLRQARVAEKQGADYIGIGPVFATPTKQSAQPVGLRMVRAVCRQSSVPVVAIGGINEQNAAHVAGAGAHCVAVVRAICTVRDPYKAAQRLRKCLMH